MAYVWEYTLMMCSITLVLFCLVQTQVTNEETVETCQLETLNVTCESEEVIIITAAWYGRMQAGRCITGKYNIGCKETVLAYMDRKCSGKQSCHVSTTDQQLHKANPCTVDLTPFLETTYQCVRVPSIVNECDDETGTARIFDQEGYLPGYIPSLHPPYNTRLPCGWHIIVLPGQLIQLSLLNFRQSSHEDSNQHTGCSDVARVNEGVGTEQTIKLCHNRHQRRTTDVYTSKTGSLNLYYIENRLPISKPRYLIKYKAIGCPDIRPNIGMWALRTNDVTTIKCNHSDETWFLTCEGQNWKGAVGNCSNYDASKKGVWSANEQTSTDEAFPYGILITVAIGVALGIFFGGILLAIVTVIRRRRNYSNSARRNCNLNSPSSLGNHRIQNTLNSNVTGHGTLDKGYLPVMDDRGQFPAAVATDIYPITTHLHQPGCPQQQLFQETTNSTTEGVSITRTHGEPVGPIAVDLNKMEPLYAFHSTDRHLYDSTCIPVTHNCHT